MASDTVLCSVVSDNFVPGFVMLERSLRATNPDWSFPMRVIYSGLDPLSERSIAVIEEHCDNVEFVMCDPTMIAPVHDYARTVIGTPERLFPAFSILEAFRWSDVDRVIALDSDMLVLGSLDPLLHAARPFNACRAFNSRTNQPASFFNTGVMVLNREILHGFDPNHIVQMLAGRTPRPGTGKADQAILNILFHNEVVGYLPRRFNYTKRSLMSDLGDFAVEPPETSEGVRAFLDERDVRILHFVGEKPWNVKVRDAENDYAMIEGIWQEALYRLGRPGLFAMIEDLRRIWYERFVSSVRQSRNRKGEVDETKMGKLMGL